MPQRVAVAFLVAAFLASDISADEPPARTQQVQQFAKLVKPLLQQFCSRCHGGKKAEGGLKIDGLNPDLVKGDDGEHWEEVLNQLNLGAMPPKGKPQPSNAQRNTLTSWITHELRYAAEVRRSTGGRNVLRRLTRYEYNNTLRDLLGIDLEFAKNLPPDGTAKEGFKNNSAVLVMSSLHLDYFQRIARDALKKALVIGERPTPFELRVEAEKTRPARQKRKRKNRKNGNAGGKAGAATKLADGMLLAPGGAIQLTFNEIPLEGPIRIRVKAGGIPGKGAVPRLHLDLGYNGGNSARPTRTVASVDVTAPRSAARWYEFHVRAENFPLKTPDRKKSQFLAISNRFDAGTVRLAAGDVPKLFVDRVEIVAPFYATWPPKTRTQILIPSKHRGDEKLYAREVIENFMRRAYRRPPTKAAVDRMHNLFLTLRSRDASFETATVGTLSAVLSSPGFLLISEPSPRDITEPKSRHLNDYEIASRLSYFLWSTMPDDVLFRLAEQKKLRDPAVLRAQVKRMLDDSRSQQFVEHFTSQWLDLDGIYRVAVNPEFFPQFRDAMKDTMRKETLAFFGTVLRDNLSSLTLLDSDFAMLNGNLARHYGIPGVAGHGFRKVALKPEHNRGGLLTHGSILTGNSSGDDTHPVKRGVWLLERLLGDPPPPPPPAVPTLAQDDTTGQRLSLKQKLFAHRQDAACMNCHRKIDPWGVAFENYDGVGAWRDTRLSAKAAKTAAKFEKIVALLPQPKAKTGKPAIDVSSWGRKPIAAASIPIADGDSDKVKKLKADVNTALEALQRPHNHLRRLGPKGAPGQHRRFLGYIVDRIPRFEAAVDALLRETGQGKAEFMKAFTARNQAVLKANATVRALAQKISPLSADRKPRKNRKNRNRNRKNRRNKRGAAATTTEVDPRTTLPDGTKIRDLRDLKAYLLKHKKDQFAETLVRKILAYSLGRYLDFSDTQTVRKLTADFKQDGYRLRGLIAEIVLSEPFLTK